MQAAERRSLMEAARRAEKGMDVEGAVFMAGLVVSGVAWRLSINGMGAVVVRGACRGGPGESVLNLGWDCAIVCGL